MSMLVTQVNIVAVVGEDFAAEDTALLESRGIDLEGLERVPGKTFFWAGKYSDDMNDRTTLATDLNVFAGFQPKLPQAYFAQPYLLMGNIQPGAPAGGAGPDERRPVRRRRHQEFLDPGLSGSLLVQPDSVLAAESADAGRQNCPNLRQQRRHVLGRRFPQFINIHRIVE